MLSADEREARLMLFYQRQIASIKRRAVSENFVQDAVSLAHDKRLPRFAIEFLIDPGDEYMPGRWAPAAGLGAALENYVSRLCEMEKVRYGHSVVEGLTCEHRRAFDAVVASAEDLERLGWPVNWEQNVQTILEPTELGIRDGSLVDRFSMPPATVTLGAELLLLGTVTFYHQKCSANGVTSAFKSRVLTAHNRQLFEDVPLHLRGDDEELPARFRYASEWTSDGSGASYRVAV